MGEPARGDGGELGDGLGGIRELPRGNVAKGGLLDFGGHGDSWVVGSEKEGRKRKGKAEGRRLVVSQRDTKEHPVIPAKAGI
jgi:hypothetical protein